MQSHSKVYLCETILNRVDIRRVEQSAYEEYIVYL